MQFPLEGLYQLLSAHTGPVSKPTSPKAGSPVIKSLKQSVLNAKLLLFTHISKSRFAKKYDYCSLVYRWPSTICARQYRSKNTRRKQKSSASWNCWKTFCRKISLHPRLPFIQKCNGQCRSQCAGDQCIANGSAVGSNAAPLVDAEIITGVTNVTHFTAIVAGFIKTSKPVPVSSESLRCKYYSPDKPSLSIVREHLLKMMRLVGSYTPDPCPFPKARSAGFCFILRSGTKQVRFGIIATGNIQ